MIKKQLKRSFKRFFWVCKLFNNSILHPSGKEVLALKAKQNIPEDALKFLKYNLFF